MPPVTPPPPPQPLGTRMVRKIDGLLHVQGTTPRERTEALRELAEWVAERLHSEARWQQATEKRRVARPSSQPEDTDP